MQMMKVAQNVFNHIRARLEWLNSVRQLIFCRLVSKNISNFVPNTKKQNFKVLQFSKPSDTIFSQKDLNFFKYVHYENGQGKFPNIIR